MISLDFVWRTSRWKTRRLGSGSWCGAFLCASPDSLPKLLHCSEPRGWLLLTASTWIPCLLASWWFWPMGKAGRRQAGWRERNPLFSVDSYPPVFWGFMLFAWKSQVRTLLQLQLLASSGNYSHPLSLLDLVVVIASCCGWPQVLHSPLLLLLTSVHAFVNSSFLKLSARTLVYAVIVSELVK